MTDANLNPPNGANRGDAEADKRASDAKHELSKCLGAAWWVICTPFRWFGRFVKAYPHEILAISTLGTVVVLALQLWVLRATDATINLQQRAWLAPHGLAVPANFRSRTNAYTEVQFSYENVGKEPATKTAIELFPGTITLEEYRNKQSTAGVVRALMNGVSCDSVQPDPNGAAIYPDQKPGYVIGFAQPLVEQVNGANHYALVVGCLVYETLGDTHRSKFCGILEPVDVARIEWRSDYCLTYNDAD